MCEVCFEIIDRGSLETMVPSVAFHFSQSLPEDNLGGDLVHSQAILRTIQRLKATHHRLVNSLLDVQLSLENEEYQQRAYLGVEQHVKKYSYAKIVVALGIFALQLYLLTRLFAGPLKNSPNQV